MPNYCELELRIHGPKKDRSIFRNFARGYSAWNDNPDEEELLLCCSNFIEPPQEAIDDYSKIGHGWCINNWGTKWGIFWAELYEEDDSYTYGASSAWNPPTPVILEMSNRFPSLTFELKFWECGMEFQGTYKVKDNVVLCDVTEDYYGSRGG